MSAEDNLANNIQFTLEHSIRCSREKVEIVLLVMKAMAFYRVQDYAAMEPLLAELSRLDPLLEMMWNMPKRS